MSQRSFDKAKVPRGPADLVCHKSFTAPIWVDLCQTLTKRTRCFPKFDLIIYVAKLNQTSATFSETQPRVFAWT